MGNILVIGSLNMDIVFDTNKFPVKGETICSNKLVYSYGGKGGNQAVAAARFGSSVSFVGSVGDDEFGKKYLNHLKEENINTDFVRVIDNTGLACIVHAEGDNEIIIYEGANKNTNCELIQEAFNKLETIDVVMVQNEIDVDAVYCALSCAKERNITTIYNPAPFKEIDEKILNLVDIVVPNEIEFQDLISEKVTESSIQSQIISFSEQNHVSCIVTLGDQGVYYFNNGEVKHIEAHRVPVVDTTGAGDTFNGTLAHFISEGVELEMAISYANYAAAMSIQKYGAQSGMPNLNEFMQRYQSREDLW